MSRKALAALFTCVFATPVAADQDSMGVHTYVAPSCTFSVDDPHVENDDGLLSIRVGVERNCNTRHRVRVTYEPTVLSRPNKLVVLFGALLPDERAPGNVAFTNLPRTRGVDRTRQLRLFYEGPESERKKIKKTLTINVGVP